MEVSVLFPFSSTLTEALILHMADRSDVDIAKYSGRKVLLGCWMLGDESRGQVAVEKCPSHEKPCASVEERENTQVNLICNIIFFPQGNGCNAVIDWW